jgi:CRP-like cAMP-binding protein
MNTTERVFFLKNVPLFARLSLPGQARIAALAEETSFRPGETLFRQGDPADCLYVILDGEVAILLDGHEINRMKAGESFGEVAVLNRGPRTAGARAATDVLALRIDRATIADLIATSAELRLAVVNELTSRIRGIRARTRTL